MSGEFIVWLSPSTKCEQSLGNEDMEEGSHEIKESIIIPTKALPSVNQSELTGKPEEPSTSSIQNGTAKGYFLKISGKHFLCAAATSVAPPASISYRVWDPDNHQGHQSQR